MGFKLVNERWSAQFRYRIYLSRCSLIIKKLCQLWVELLTKHHLRAMGCHLSYGWHLSYGISVTCHLTQVNTPRLTPATGLYSIYLPRRDGRLSWPRWLVTTRSVCQQTVTHPSSNPSVHGRELNSEPVGHDSDALTTTVLSRDVLCYFHSCHL